MLAGYHELEVTRDDVREVTSGLWMLGLLLSEEAGEGNNVSVDLFGFLSAVCSSHCECVCEGRIGMKGGEVDRREGQLEKRP